MFQIFSWGANSHGQLGQGHCSEQCELPLALGQLPRDLRPADICEIRGGGGHLLLLDRRGQVFVCGSNERGQLGLGESAGNRVPQLRQIPAEWFGGEKVRAVRAGWDMSAAITEAGNVFVWGSNAFGQLGLSGSPRSVDRPIKLPPPHTSACVDLQFGLRFTLLRHRSHLVVIGAPRTLQKIARNATHPGELHPGAIPYWSLAVSATHASCGTEHIAYIATDTPRHVHGCGDNRHGQSSPAALEVASDCAQLRSGWTHNAVRTRAGKVWLWGRNNYGQLGRKEVDVAAGFDYLQAPEEDGGVLDDVEQLHLGAEHGLLVRRDGALLTWGWNEHGNCGVGGVADVWRPRRVQLPGRCVLAGTGCGFCVAIVEVEGSGVGEE